MSGTADMCRGTLFILDKDGHPTLDVLPETAGGKNLIGIKDHIDALNNPESPNSNVNPQGAVTDPNFHVCIRTGFGKYGIIIGHEFNPFVYRGENKNYEKFTPSALRCKRSDDERFCIEMIKQWEFQIFFQSLPYYSRCREFNILGNYFDFDLQAIQQHYGFISRYIDMSKDEEIAKFFAYTYQKDGEYFPIEDFREYSPTLYSGNLKEIYYKTGGRLKFIGFQGLLRPFKQKAMAIDAPEGSDMKLLFEKIELDKDPEIARRIFRKYKHGRALFPKRDYFGEIVRKIQENKCLSREFFGQYCNEAGIADPGEIEKKINAAGYILTDTDGIPEYDADKLDKELDKNLISFYKNVRYRLGTPITDDTDLPRVRRKDKSTDTGDPGTNSRQE